MPNKPTKPGWVQIALALPPGLTPRTEHSRGGENEGVPSVTTPIPSGPRVSASRIVQLRPYNELGVSGHPDP